MKTLIILHGWQSSKERWQKVKEGIEKEGIKVIVPDIPGFKPETELKKLWNLDNYTNWFNRFIVSENITEPFFLLGHSFGGAVAVKFALKYPEKVEKLFLVSAACVRKKAIKKTFLKNFSKIFKIFSFLPFYNFFRKVFYKLFVGKTDYLSVKGVMKETYLKVINEDLSTQLHLIKSPTIIIWGGKDDVTAINQAYFINKEINNSKLIIIPEANHDLNRKNPEILSQKILDNLK